MKRFDIEVYGGHAYLVGNPVGKYVTHKDAQDTLTALFDVTAQRDELLAVLECVLPWVVTQEVACHGLKCREPVCMSCSSDSEEAAEKATYAYEAARAAIQKVRGGE